jgi:uncharacterized membrane protein
MGHFPWPGRMAGGRVALGVVQAVIVLAYPLAVFYGLTHFGVREVGLLLLVLLVPSTLFRLRRVRGRALLGVLLVPALVAALIGTSMAVESATLILLLPALINLALLATFTGSLWTGTSMIERYALLVEPELTPEKRRYCRRVTVAWSAFFVANGGAALGLALWAPLEWWALHTGLVSYVLIGIGFGIEYGIRKYRFRE